MSQNDNVPPGLDEFIASVPTSGASVPSSGTPPGLDEFIQEEALQEKYGGVGQQAIAGLEALGRGVAGPLVPLAEKALGVDPADMRGRAAANEMTALGAEATGLIGGLLVGTGVGGLAAKAGTGATKVAGLGRVLEAETLATKAAQAGKAAEVLTAAGAPEAAMMAARAAELGAAAEGAAKGVSLSAKVGSSAVQQAAEMAVIQSGSELSKMVMEDPNTSAETALSNIGLAAALGAGGGTLITGGISPLWKATGGPKLEKFLTGFKDHLNGVGRLPMPENIAAAESLLGVELTAIQKAAISGDPKAAMLFKQLKNNNHPEILKSIDDLHEATNAKVTQSLGVHVDDVANYDANHQGKAVIDAFKREYDEKFTPIQKQYDLVKEASHPIQLADDVKLAEYAKLVESGQKYGAAGSPQAKLFDDYGNRLLSQNSIGQVDKLIHELNNEMKKAFRAGDMNNYGALKDIKTSLNAFQETEIANASMAGLAPRSFTMEGAEVNAARAMANEDYKRVASISQEMSQHLGLGEFRGQKALMAKLADKKSPEQVLKALSPKNNADLIPFLAEHFPATLKAVQENELKQLIRPAILAAKEGEAINLKVLTNAIEKLQAGNAEYLKFVMPEDLPGKIAAAKTLKEAIPHARGSAKVEGWQEKLFGQVPASALAMVSFLAGQNPMGGYVVGTLMKLLGGEVPDAVKLSLLRFLSSEAPVKAEGFKAMADFITNTAKGEAFIAKSVKNLMKPGAYVLTEAQMPTAKEIAKLDKLVAENEQDPSKFMNLQGASRVGDYLPDHQAALSESSVRAMQYLSSIKPRDTKNNPLDKTFQPNKSQLGRYNKALEIAQQPAIVLQKMKDGSLQLTDLQDLKAMYPSLYQTYATKIISAAAGKQADEEPIPYKTRVSMSLFLGQPMDATMTPQAIQAAQPVVQQSPMAQQQMPQGPPGKITNEGGKALQKGAQSYKTADQASEGRRANPK